MELSNAPKSNPLNGTDITIFSNAIKRAAIEIHQVAWNYDYASKPSLESDLAKIDAFIMQLQKTWGAMRVCIEQKITSMKTCNEIK